MAHPYAGQAQSSLNARLKRLGASAGKAHGYSSMYKKKSYPGKNAGSSTPLTISGGKGRSRPDRMAAGGRVGGKRKGHTTTNIIISHGGAGGAQAPAGPPAVVNRPVPVPVGGPPPGAVPPRPPMLGAGPPIPPRPPMVGGPPPGGPPVGPPPGMPMRPPGMKKGGAVKKAAYGGLGATKKNDDDGDDDDSDDYGDGGLDYSDLAGGGGGGYSGPPQAGPPANFGQTPPSTPTDGEGAKKGGSVKKRQGGGGGIFAPRQGVMVPTKPGRPQNLSGAGRRPPVPNPVPVRTVAGFRAAPPPGLLPGFKKGGKVKYAEGGDVPERVAGLKQLGSAMKTESAPLQTPAPYTRPRTTASNVSRYVRPGLSEEKGGYKKGGIVHDDEAEDKALMAREFKKRGLASGGIVKTPVTNASGGGAGGKSRKAKSSAARGVSGQTGSPSPGRTPPPRGMSGSKYHQQGKGLK